MEISYLRHRSHQIICTICIPLCQPLNKLATLESLSVSSSLEETLRILIQFCTPLAISTDSHSMFPRQWNVAARYSADCTVFDHDVTH